MKSYVDANFVGGWDPEDAENADNVYSHTGYVICYVECPMLWQSKLQTEIALLTAEAEYIALSLALRETIPMTNLMCGMDVIFHLHLPTVCLTSTGHLILGNQECCLAPSKTMVEQVKK